MSESDLMMLIRMVAQSLPIEDHLALHPKPCHVKNIERYDLRIGGSLRECDWREYQIILEIMSMAKITIGRLAMNIIKYFFKIISDLCFR